MFKRILIPILSLALGAAFAADSVAVSKKKPDLSKGKKIYETYCITCHGPKGMGDGPTAAALNPKPRNYTDTALMAKTPMETLRKAVGMGGASVGLSPMMPAWKGTLKDKDIDEVLNYVLITFSGKGSKKFEEIAKAAEKSKDGEKTKPEGKPKPE